MSENTEEMPMADQLQAFKKNQGIILLDGATGYVGSHLTHCLSQQGLSVRCLVRPQADQSDVALLKACSAEIYEVDLLSRTALIEKAFDGARVAIHLIGSIAPKRGESLHSLHVEQTKRFAEYCSVSQVSKTIMVTALGTSKDALSEYHRTKWLAEEELRKSGLNCLFIRPSLLVGRTFGQRDSKVVKRFRELISEKPLVPIIDGGTNKIQPLFIEDLVASIAKCAVAKTDSYERASVFELGGPEVMTMRKFVEELMKALGYSKKFVNLPIALANSLAFLAEMVQDVPIISRDQIKLSSIDNVCSVNDLSGKLGIKPVSVSEALRSYTKAWGDMVTMSLSG